MAAQAARRLDPKKLVGRNQQSPNSREAQQIQTGSPIRPRLLQEVISTAAQTIYHLSRLRKQIQLSETPQALNLHEELMLLKIGFTSIN